MAAKLRVGIIGAGAAALGHATAYASLPDVEVVALWSQHRERAESLAAKVGSAGDGRPTVYNRWQDVVERAEIDTLSIATPAVLRREPIVAALDRGVSVLVEKPPSLSLAEARDIAALGERAVPVTAVAFNWRYAPGALAARRALRSGEIGRLLDIRMEWRWGGLRLDPKRVDGKLWMGQREMGGGMMREGGIHELDRARFLTGNEVTEVVGRVLPWFGSPFPLSNRPEMTGDSGYALLANLSGGGLGIFRYTLTWGQPEWQIVLCGAEGSLIVTNEGATRLRKDEAVPATVAIDEADRLPPGLAVGQHTWNRLVADFVTAVRAGGRSGADVPYLPDFVDGVRAMEIVEAAELSEGERRWVPVADLGRLPASAP